MDTKGLITEKRLDKQTQVTSNIEKITDIKYDIYKSKNTTLQ